MGKSRKTAAAAPAAVPKGIKKRDAEDEIEKAVSANKKKKAVPGPPAKAVPQSKKDNEKAKNQPPPKKVESSRSSEEDFESKVEYMVIPKAPAAKRAKQVSSYDDSSNATSESNETGKLESSSAEGSFEESDDDEDDKPAAPLKKQSVVDAQMKKEDTSKSDSNDHGYPVYGFPICNCYSRCPIFSESDSEDDTHEEVDPKFKAPAAATKNEDYSGSESQSDFKVENVNKTHTAKRAASKMKDESSDESDSENEKPLQKKRKEAPKAAKKGSNSKDDDGSSSEERSDDEPTKVEQKKVLDDDSDEDSEDPGNAPEKGAPVHASEKQTATEEAFKEKQSNVFFGRQVRLDFDSGSKQSPRSSNDGSFQKLAWGGKNSTCIRSFDKTIEIRSGGFELYVNEFGGYELYVGGYELYVNEFKPKGGGRSSSGGHGRFGGQSGGGGRFAGRRGGRDGGRGCGCGCGGSHI